MKKICYYVTNSGKIRKNNEDCIQINNKIFSKQNNKKGFKFLKNNSLVSVCDGMGGEEFGEEASLIAVSHLSQIKEYTKESILKTINTINDLVCEEMKKKSVRMGSTIVTAVVKGNSIDIYNLGDSRAYLYNGKLIQLSKDHTVERLKGQKKGALTQHIGIFKEELEIEPFVLDNIEFNKNNYLLLCSDGLYDMIEESEIESILSSKVSSRKKRNKLLERAMENGGKDNISFLLIHCK